jgi:single-strand DNA-binding protein
MSGLCKALIIGNLGRDPEMRYTPNGRPVTTFSVACNHVYTAADGERREETEWFRVSAWGKLGETCSQYLKKGSRVYVEGRLRTRTWEGQDGQKRTDLEVIASDMRILDPKGRGEPTEVAGDEHGIMDADQIPF